MIRSKLVCAAVALAFSSAPAMAASTISDPISDPAAQWAGIDYWGVQVSQFTFFDQLLSFTVPYDSKIDVYMKGSSKFLFSDMQLNGHSIASGFTVDDSTFLKSTGYAVAGNVSLRIIGDYTCKSCWGDWFGGYVQVSKGTSPTVTGAVPEPASWMTMIAGMAVVGVFLRRRLKKSSSFA